MKKKIIIGLLSAFAFVTLSSFVVSEWYTCKSCNGKGYQYTRNCSRCGGRGETSQVINCTRCNGKGYIRDNYGDQQRCPQCDGAKKELKTERCSACNGSGEEPMPCRACGGKGQVWIDDWLFLSNNFKPRSQRYITDKKVNEKDVVFNSLFCNDICYGCVCTAGLLYQLPRLQRK